MIFAGVRGLMQGGLNLSNLPRVLLRRWRMSIVTVLVPAALAVVLGSLLPRWYEAAATLNVEAPATLSGASSSVLGLASSLGLGIGAQPQSPQFYADLFTSRVLLERLLAARYPLGAGASLESLESFWNKQETQDARRHDRNLRILSRHISASANPRTGVISVSMEGPTPVVSRLMVDTALAALNQLVVSMRRQRASAERQFLEERWAALHDSLTAHENTLRMFYEHNRTMGSPELQFEEMRLRREVDRVQAVYVQIGTQLEQARIQEVRDTPVITVIDPPITPVRKSSPKLRLLALAGAVAGLCMVLTTGLLLLGEERLHLVAATEPRRETASFR